MTLMLHIWNTAWKALLSAEQSMKVMVIIYLTFKKEKQTNTKTYLLSLGSTLKSPLIFL